MTIVMHMAQNTERTIDVVALKALAHPLRVQILDALSVYGPATASGLAERLGESSGATSYHLRQLERHAFVREIEGRGTGRERWWERVPGGIKLSATEFADSESARAASRLVLREWSTSRERLLHDFLDNGDTQLPSHWIEATSVNTANTHVTAEQLAGIVQRVNQLVDEFIETHRGQRVPGSRPVQLQFNAFPVMDGVEIPAEAPAEIPEEQS